MEVFIEAANKKIATYSRAGGERRHLETWEDDCISKFKTMQTQ